MHPTIHQSTIGMDHKPKADHICGLYNQNVTRNLYLATKIWQLKRDDVLHVILWKSLWSSSIKKLVIHQHSSYIWHNDMSIINKLDYSEAVTRDQTGHCCLLILYPICIKETYNTDIKKSLYKRKEAQMAGTNHNQATKPFAELPMSLL